MSISKDYSILFLTRYLFGKPFLDFSFGEPPLQWQKLLQFHNNNHNCEKWWLQSLHRNQVIPLLRGRLHACTIEILAGRLVLLQQKKRKKKTCRRRLLLLLLLPRSAPFRCVETPPDRPFHKIRASKFVDRLILCSSETSINGFWNCERVGRVG